MPIVLAIEPDRRQAAHLTAIVRHQVGAELVLADTTEGALDAIGNRVPDLVLVPALLSPQDDAALAAALRVIAAAAHVRTLTIPVLASGTTRAAAGGMLAKWRKVRAASPEPDGCDPAVFGEQISTYLKEAADERAQIADDLLDDEPFATPAPLALEPELRHHTPALNSDTETQPFAAALHSDSNSDAEAEPFMDTTDGQPFEAVEPLWADTVEPLAARTVDETLDDLEEPVVDLSEELEGLSEDGADGELFDGERVGVYTIGVDAGEAALDALDALDTFDVLPSILEPPATEAPVAVEAAETMTADVAGTIADQTLAVASEAPCVEPPESPSADIRPWVPMYLTPGRLWPALEGMPAEMPVARTEQPDWIELVASLRQDIERRRTEPASATTHPIAARPSDGAHADAHRLVKKARAQARKAQPVQDEWGFFDPEQCGFSTLLAKLEEITDDGTIAR